MCEGTLQVSLVPTVAIYPKVKARFVCTAHVRWVFVWKQMIYLWSLMDESISRQLMYFDRCVVSIALHATRGRVYGAKGCPDWPITCQ